MESIEKGLIDSDLGNSEDSEASACVPLGDQVCDDPQQDASDKDKEKRKGAGFFHLPIVREVDKLGAIPFHDKDKEEKRRADPEKERERKEKEEKRERERREKEERKEREKREKEEKEREKEREKEEKKEREKENKREKEKEKKDQEKEKGQMKEMKRMMERGTKEERERRKAFSKQQKAMKGQNAMETLKKLIESDFEKEKSAYAQRKAFLQDVCNRLAKVSQRNKEEIETRKALAQTFKEYVSNNEITFPLSECLSKIGDVFLHTTNEREELNKYVTQQMSSDFSEISKDVLTTAKTSKKEFVSLLDRYNEEELKIGHYSNKETVSVQSVAKLSEAEEARHLIQERMKQLGHATLLQLRNAELELTNNMLLRLCDYLDAQETYYKNCYRQLKAIRPFIQEYRDHIEKVRHEIDEKTDEHERITRELGHKKEFKKIIKKHGAASVSMLGETGSSKKKEKKKGGKNSRLHVVTAQGRLDLLKTLLESQTLDVNMRDEYGRTALHVAAAEGSDEIMSLLIERGGDVNIRDNDGNTPLHIAAASGHASLVMHLLSVFSRRNVENNRGESALHLASRQGHTDICMALLETGCDTSIRGIEGLASDVAATPELRKLITNCGEVLQCLSEKGYLEGSMEDREREWEKGRLQKEKEWKKRDLILQQQRVRDRERGSPRDFQEDDSDEEGIDTLTVGSAGETDGKGKHGRSDRSAAREDTYVRVSDLPDTKYRGKQPASLENALSSSPSTPSGALASSVGSSQPGSTPSPPYQDKWPATSLNEHPNTSLLDDSATPRYPGIRDASPFVLNRTSLRECDSSPEIPSGSAPETEEKPLWLLDEEQETGGSGEERTGSPLQVRSQRPAITQNPNFGTAEMEFRDDVVKIQRRGGRARRYTASEGVSTNHKSATNIPRFAPSLFSGTSEELQRTRSGNAVPNAPRGHREASPSPLTAASCSNNTSVLSQPWAVVSAPTSPRQQRLAQTREESASRMKPRSVASPSSPAVVKLDGSRTKVKRRSLSVSSLADLMESEMTGSVGDEEKTMQRYDSVLSVKKEAQFLEKPLAFEVQKRRKTTRTFGNRSLVVEKDTIILRRGKKETRRNGAQLLQCVKSLNNNKKLRLVWRLQNATEEYIFSNAEERERFYQACWMSRWGLKPKAFPNDRHEISIFIGTWNMGDAPPDRSLEPWIPRNQFDIYAIGAQECSYDPGLHKEQQSGQKLSCELDWFNRLKKHLGKEYIKLAGLSLASIRLIVFVRRIHYQSITQTATGIVPTGVAGLAGNKGGVGISHLAAHQEKIEHRNSDYRDIIRGLSSSAEFSIPNFPFDITNTFDHTFWCGDLNYRIDVLREEAFKMINQRKWTELWEKDQLRREMENEHVFLGFSEEAIVFKPTYKYVPGHKDLYTEYKMRVPAWCDRVLVRSLPSVYKNLTHMAYGCCDDLTSSDHHPVFAAFQCRTLTPLPPPQKNCRATIRIGDLRIEGLRFANNEGTPDPYVTFHAPFLTNTPCTVAQSRTRDPVWQDNEVPPLVPFIGEASFLTRQTLRLLVEDKRKSDSKSLSARKAQAVVALKGAVRILGKAKTPFRVKLTSNAYGNCGIISGTISIDMYEVDDGPLTTVTGTSSAPVHTASAPVKEKAVGLKERDTAERSKLLLSSEKIAGLSDMKDVSSSGESVIHDFDAEKELLEEIEEI